MPAGEANSTLFSNGPRSRQCPAVEEWLRVPLEHAAAEERVDCSWAWWTRVLTVVRAGEDATGGRCYPRDTRRTLELLLEMGIIESSVGSG